MLEAAPTKPVKPFISVIVPIRNEAPFIEGTLRQLLDQTYDKERFEVLVIDGHSTDGTRQIVEQIAAIEPAVILLDNPRRLSSAARNVGAQAARGDLLVVVDGHCQLPGEEYLRDLADAFHRSGADCLGRPQPLQVAGANTLQRAIAAARASWLGHHPASHIYSYDEQFVPPGSVAVAYRREVFDHIGYFDDRFDACEDVEFNHRVARAGLKCFQTPKVRVHYHPRSSLQALFGQMVRYGRGRMRLLRKHRDTFSLGSFIPALFVLGLLVGPALFLLGPWGAAAYAGPLALYTACVLSVSISLALAQRSWRMLPWLPLVFVTVHIGAGFGVLREALSGPVARRGR